MIIPCGEIASNITQGLKKKVSLLKSEGENIKLLAVLVGDQPEQHSYVRMKQNLANTLGIGFEFLHFPELPPFETFLNIVREKSSRDDIYGIIIQLPLPQEYNQQKIYATFPHHKEIEGHHAKSKFVFPLVQACMIGLDWVCNPHHPVETQYEMPFTPSEKLILWLQKKQITIAGRGMTTGKPIASYFDSLNIPYAQTNSSTSPSDADIIYRNSDIIICGVGKKIISKENIKKGVVLLNFGLHKPTEGGSSVHTSKLLGDYDEKEIQDIASFYSKTPGGLGPIDILCLYGNLIESATNTNMT